MNKLYSKLHNLYSLSKTLRFELRPVGKTKENFEEYILASDEEKADKFKIVKSYADEYHKYFIENALSNFNSLNFDTLLTQYYELFVKNNRTEKEDKEFEDIQKKLRKEISECFTKHNYKKLLSEKLFSDYLPNFYKDDEEKLADIKIFSRFTTLFAGYHTNRQNMYTADEKSTAIAFRLINQNLPTFIKNRQNYQKIKEYMPTINDTISSKLGIDAEKFFSLEYYSNILTQTGIDEYNYILGGKTTETGEKIQGINEFINLYNQRNSDKKLPKLKQLYKQILSDKTNVSFKIDKLSDDKETVELINSYYEILKPLINTENKETEIITPIKNITDYDTSKIWINSDNLTYLSQQIYGDWGFINYLIREEYKKQNPKTAKQSTEKYEEKINTDLKRIKEYSLNHIEDLVKENDASLKNKLFDYFKANIIKLTDNIKVKYTDCSDILNNKYDNGSRILLSDTNKIQHIKDFLDSIKQLQIFVKLLIPKSVGIETDDNFYNALNYDTLSEIIPVYNKVRNFVTQKPYSVEKFPLTFECPTLLSGWDLNKEQSNLCVLLKKENYYYLGIMNKKNNKIFNDLPTFDGNNGYEKFEYKFFKDATTMIPKCSTQMKAVKNHFTSSAEDFILDDEKSFYKPLKITKEIFELNNKLYDDSKKFQIDYLRKTGDTDGYNHALKVWLKFCLDFLQSYKSTVIYDFSDINIENYTKLDAFYKDINLKLYKITTKNISEDYINNLVNDGKLFLFQIYNKDFSPYAKGTPNLHTMYWKALFDEDNLKDVVYKLNGGAEIFYRRKSIEGKVTHPKNQPIENKNPLNKKKESTFEYDLIKDKRFSLDKFLFHVPIALNFKSQNIEYINEFVNSEIQNTSDINIIGVDRGERNLIYITVINSKGELLEQHSLNEIINSYKGETYKTDYHQLLDKKEKERDKARKSWGTIENIKELKEGYMSQVVHKITELMLKYNALIVLEDLNSGFKNSRKKVEKQVYDKFETMLTNKLSYLVNKKAGKFDEGGLYNAYQLVNKETNGRQSGVLFYIPAWNTSKIDPVTGFVNLFYIKNMSIEKTKEFFNKFKSITYNKQDNLFEFNFDYSDFTDKSCGIRNNWTVCTYGDRIKTFRNPEKNNEWDNEEINLTGKFKELFEKYSIDLNDIKTDIQNQNDRKFFDELTYLFKLTLQMRNSVTGTDIDYILSPVRDKDGNFYDSRKGIETLPKDADANGAYNIARKGLMLVNQIKQAEDLHKLRLTPITNAEWLEFVQGTNT